MHEHWSLVVAKDPDRQKFEAGDFTSVSFEMTCERLQKVVQSPVPDEARKNFDTVRKHRNKMVHFFHEADFSSGPKIEAVAREQLRAWHDLQQLLTVQWANVFQTYRQDFNEIERKLKGHREYLRAKFDGLAPRIAHEKANKAVFRTCGSCGFDAATQIEILGALLESECLVCGYHDKWLDFTCTDCGEVSPLRDGGEFRCEHCGCTADGEMIADTLNEFSVTVDNYLESIVPANCSKCDGYHTVIEFKSRYLCVSCLFVSNELSSCEYCGESSNGNMEDSYLSGCSLCEGSAGGRRDKDD
ncbi:hypothetical protein GCM10011611_14900 [Aliidongia dinghuensis]|uniref:HsdR n=2 Tax=Aliidongia dinghuensis TaxID=1867774 RepID=A0A8J2YRM6_9PROT|nr:hypothetical protein GCM10011611_14900 [Aliidongia dinghuensis]